MRDLRFFNSLTLRHARAAVFCVLALLATLVVDHRAIAEPIKESELHSPFSARLEQLKSIDPQIAKLTEWESVAASLSERIEKDPANAPTLLFQLGKLHERIFRVRGSRASLARSMEAYERLARLHERHALADDALLALGDLRRDGLQDETAARAAYFEIVDQYGKGNVSREAKARLSPPPLESAKAKEGPDVTSKTEPPVRTTLADVASATKSSSLSRTLGTEDLTVVKEPPGQFEPTGRRTREVFARENTSRRPLVVIDAGHGGEDLGAHGPDGILEKDIVLNIAEYLDELLRDRLRARTVMTRTSDVFIPLPDRTRIANEQNADLFISIHANASELKTASGVETYYLDNTNNKSSLKLAERENMSLQFGGGGSGSDLGFMLSDLIQNVKLDDSITLAHKLQDATFRTLSQYYEGVNNLGVKKAPFYVLVGAHMPCVLTEVSFIDHPVEGRRLADRKYQKLVANALFQGIREFFTPREER